MKAHRRRLAHQEMIQAQTTAAIINFAFSPPQSPVEPSVFCFNLDKPKVIKVKFTKDELLDWDTRVMNLANELKAGGGPMLDAIRKESDV